MRRVVLAIASTVTALVLLLGFKTHTPSTSATATPPAAVAGPTATAGGSTATAGGSTAAAPTTSGTRTVTGTAADTRYGPVQVKITVTDGKVTAVAAVVYPDGNPRDQQINSYAVPQLDQEATAARTAHIDTVSGATYTSDGYVTSLQSALDQAGLG